MSTVVELHSHLPSLIDILLWTRPRVKIFYVGLSPRYGYFSGSSSEIQEDFFAPDFYLNCFFLYSFLLFDKGILLLILLIQTQQFRVLILLWKNCICRKNLYLKGKACQLAVLTFNTSPPTCQVALKYGSSWELVISVTLNSVRQAIANVCALH